MKTVNEKQFNKLVNNPLVIACPHNGKQIKSKGWGYVTRMMDGKVYCIRPYASWAKAMGLGQLRGAMAAKGKLDPKRYNVLVKECGHRGIIVKQLMGG